MIKAQNHDRFILNRRGCCRITNGTTKPARRATTGILLEILADYERHGQGTRPRRCRMNKIRTGDRPSSTCTMSRENHTPPKQQTTDAAWYGLMNEQTIFRGSRFNDRWTAAAGSTITAYNTVTRQRHLAESRARSNDAVDPFASCVLINTC
jgi:hypothetical protein